MTVTVSTNYLGNGKATLTWKAINEPNIKGWRVGRDGTDTHGTPEWFSHVLPPNTTTYTFNDLLPDEEYTLTLVAVYASWARKVLTTTTTTPTPPPPTTNNTAATKYNWGTPDPSSDVFNYQGLPNPAKWNIYGKGGKTGNDGKECWPGHAGNGRRCVYTNYCNGEFLRQTGYPNGDSAGISHKLGQKYGRWEIRARILDGPGSGRPYHPVLITWPDSNQWPSGAEYDFLEVNVGDTAASAFLHFPNHQPRRQEYASRPNVDLSIWHNYGFEWAPTHLKGFIDGQEWFHFNKDGIQNAPGPMHLTIQLDNFHGGQTMSEAYFDIQWANVYPYRT